MKTNFSVGRIIFRVSKSEETRLGPEFHSESIGAMYSQLQNRNIRARHAKIPNGLENAKYSVHKM